METIQDRTLQLAIDAYKTILRAKKPLRQFGNFIDLFNDEKEDHIPVPLGGGDFPAESGSGQPEYICKHISVQGEVCSPGIRDLYGLRD